MAEYHFEVREVTLRTAIVQAGSAAKARELLNAWGHDNCNQGGLANDGGPISLGDLDSVGFRFRSIVAPR